MWRKEKGGSGTERTSAKPRCATNNMVWIRTRTETQASTPKKKKQARRRTSHKTVLLLLLLRFLALLRSAVG
jgi:hypothetical protein